ncbi:copper chaperone PCu(A)C [Massilia sp. W12]|uniref:copper chaperone PCu(A)C n=1 Tax=Massilia sp. W12 TaxID=3126507 RepID=UPI0030CF72B3
MKKILFSLAASALLATLPAAANEVKLGALKISQAYARASVPGQMSGAAYLKLENTGKQADRLRKASSAAAESVEIHTMEMSGDVMQMRAMEDLALPAGAKVEMQSGKGAHLMLMGLKAPLKAGQTFPMQLEFEKAGKVEVMIKVEAPKSGK